VRGDLNPAFVRSVGKLQGGKRILIVLDADRVVDAESEHAARAA
jgi:chemotaxis signal transduction protein